MFKKKKQSKKMNSIQKDNKIVKENNEIEEELEKPKNAKKTLKRLILSIKEEYKRHTYRYDFNCFLYNTYYCCSAL